MDDRTRIRLLEEENERLRGRVDWLEDTFLGMNIPIPIEWGLTASEAKVVRALARRSELTKEQIMTALYSGRNDGEEPDMKIVDVLVHKIRRKVDGFGVSIATLWGRGYALDATTRQLLNEHTKRVVAGYVPGSEVRT